MRVGECEGLVSELQESQKAGAELMQEQDVLHSRIAAQEGELADLTQTSNDLKYAHGC